MGRTNEKRSMDDALRSPEALAFLKEGQAGGGKVPTQISDADRRPKPKGQDKPEQSVTRAKQEKQPVQRIRMTFRLPARIADGLIDASAERRKNRVKSWSQQDIAAEALELWLKKHLWSAR